MSGLRASQRVGVLGLAVVLFAAACGSTSSSSAPILTGEPPTTRIPIVIDADFDISDIAAIAILLRDPKLDVRAISITGTGLVHCQGGRLLARYLLDELEASAIPFGCGRENPGKDGRSFPDEWRAAADAGFGFDITPRVEAGVPLDAVKVIGAAVADSPSAPTIVTLGPLTNVEDAFAADPELADRVAAIHAMLGTVEAPGNVLVDDHTPADQLEWNAFADPSAVAAVFATEVPIAIVPLDATDDVPVPADLVDRLEADHGAAGADLVRELLIRNPNRLLADQGQQLWDELAALVVTDPDLANWTESALTVAEDGRLTQDEAGRPARFADSADPQAVETALLAALRQGGPRATPFQLAGELSVTFDGRICAISGRSDRDGPHRLVFTGPKGEPSGVAIIGTAEPHTWQDVLALLPTLDVQTDPPDWVVVGPAATDDSGAGSDITTTGELNEGFYGPVCLHGEWPHVAFTAGTPFEVGSGAIGS
jgi:inosine-uridine nucleoside N-ribohydrolase